MKNIQPKIDFKAKQLEFTTYIRHPETAPIPLGIKKHRMQMYRQLFFNNVESFLSGNFPVLQQILSDSQWLALVEDFFANHHSTTPYFVEIPEEFLEYLQDERQNPEDFPFLLELAHYEWVEMALSIAKAEPLETALNPTDDVLNATLEVSPLAWPLAYSYPVHKISPDYLPLTAPEQPTFFILYRDMDDAVHFMETTAATYRLLQIAQEQEQITVQACLQQLAAEIQHTHPEQIINAGLEAIKELAAKNIVGFVG